MLMGKDRELQEHMDNVRSFLAQKLNNVPLTVVGDGNQTRDFTHVNDLVEAVIKVAEHSTKNEIFNVASGEETTVNKIADMIGGKKISIPKRPGEPDRSLADISKIKRKLDGAANKYK